MFGIIMALLTIVGILVIIRILGGLEILWCIIPDRTFVFKTKKGNETGDLTKGGGGIVDILHAIPGKKLLRISDNLEKWKLVDGRERRSILYHFLGVTWIGPFHSLRTNKIRRFRYVRMGDANGSNKTIPEAEREKNPAYADYYLMLEELITKFVPYSGELAISVTDAETTEIFPLNFLFNLVKKTVFPYRSVMMVADPNSVLSGMIKQRVNALTGQHNPNHFLKANDDTTNELINAARLAFDDILKVIGDEISQINLIATDMDEKDRTLFESKPRATIDGQAAVIKVKAEAKQEEERQRGVAAGRRHLNTVDAERVRDVIVPAAATELTVRVREAEAYERNGTVTIYAPGRTPVLPLSQ